jgi:hypothetical protein
MNEQQKRIQELDKEIARLKARLTQKRLDKLLKIWEKRRIQQIKYINQVFFGKITGKCQNGTCEYNPVLNRNKVKRAPEQERYWRLWAEIQLAKLLREMNSHEQI